MRFLTRALTGLFLLSVTVGLLAYAGNSFYGALQDRWAQESRQRPARERVLAVNIVPFTPETIAPVLTSFGEVQSRRTLDLRLPVGGTITDLSDGFQEGATVAAGDLLLSLDDRDADSALAVAQADLIEAQGNLREAERALVLANEELAATQAQLTLRTQALQRQRDLAARGVGSQAAVETAELAEVSAAQAVVTRRQAISQAEAAVDQATTALTRRQINLTEAERRLEEVQLRAAFDGTLAEVVVLQGGRVTANEKLGQLIDPTALEVSFRLSTAQYARLLSDQGTLPGLDVTVRLDAGGIDLTAQGQIDRVSAAVGEGQTGRLVFARLDQAAGFRPGDFVTVEVTEPALDRVVRLPASALDAANTVLLIGDEDRLEQATVDLLRRQGDDVLVRARGLAGRQVVAERSPLLGAGIKVRPLAPVAEGAAALPAGPELVELDEARRQRLIAFVEGNMRMPQEVKDRLLSQLTQDKVPAQMVSRIEGRMGG